MELDEVREIAHASATKAASVRKGWLWGEGSPVPESVYEKAKAFIDAQDFFTEPFGVLPMEDGGLSIEYDVGSWSFGIEFLPDGSSSFFGVDTESDAEFFNCFSSDKYNRFLQVVRDSVLQTCITTFQPEN